MLWLQIAMQVVARVLGKVLRDMAAERLITVCVLLILIAMYVMAMVDYSMMLTGGDDA